MSTSKLKASDSQKPLVINLSRPVDVYCFRVVGEVGFATRRDDIRAIVQLGVEQGGHLTAHDLCYHLLGGKPPEVGRRLLELCARLDLITWEKPSRNDDHVATLTEEGRNVAERGSVFVPERGTWTIWITDDPLVPYEERLLRLEPFKEPHAGADLKNERTIIELPEWVEDACDMEGVPSWGDGREVSNISLEAKAEEVDPSAQLMLKLRAAPNEPTTVRLSGTVNGKGNERELPDALEMSFEEIWQACLGRRRAEWDSRSLAVPFSELDSAAREAFETSLRFKSISLPECGEFGAFEVRRIPVRPMNDEDASTWANWLLQTRTHSYVSAADYQRRCSELRERFRGYRVEMKTQAALAAAIRQAGGERPERRYWHLQAPLDWALNAQDRRP